VLVGPRVGMSVGAGEDQGIGVVSVAGELVVAGEQGCVEGLGECQVAGVVGGVVAVQRRMLGRLDRRRPPTPGRWCSVS
jgi:hypothetical protein